MANLIETQNTNANVQLETPEAQRLNRLKTMIEELSIKEYLGSIIDQDKERPDTLAIVSINKLYLTNSVLTMIVDIRYKRGDLLRHREGWKLEFDFSEIFYEEVSLIGFNDDPSFTEWEQSLLFSGNKSWKKLSLTDNLGFSYSIPEVTGIAEYHFDVEFS